MQPRCFVIMGYGEKADLRTGRTLDLDKAYYHLIKPAIEAAGALCERADEIQHAGIIDRPMYDRLLKADLVVADLSTSNLNAIYELGVRYALRPRATVVIAEKEFQNPFDTNPMFCEVLCSATSNCRKQARRPSIHNRKRKVAGVLPVNLLTIRADCPYAIIADGFFRSTRTRVEG